MRSTIGYLRVEELKTYPGIYHSSQTPGWVSWAGLLQLNNGDLLVGLNEVTGSRCPMKPAPLPPEMAVFGNDFYNFSGLNRTFKIVKCADPGVFLARWQDYHVEALEDSPWQPAIVLLCQTRQGALLRCTQGRRLPQAWPCGALSRSEDNGKTWSPYQPVGPMDPNSIFVICRVIVLRDGRLLMAAYGRDPARDRHPSATDVYLLTSDDDGRTWSEPRLAMTGEDSWCSGEPAIVELANGDILMMTRTTALKEKQTLDACHPAKGPNWNRRQVRLKKQGNTWTPGPIERLDIPHGGHPELLMTREGVLLYSSAEGFWGSDDEGGTWTRVATLPIASYYPVSTQLQDGRILVVGHNGGDTGYPPTSDMMLWKVSFRIHPDWRQGARL